ncbi:type II toxin-antitoxin system VapC family toxin [Desulfurivibrio alkaliphilus]|uniref:PilT protein domain protein n=1 Tax=Desulfurivibrio alkaliphilus (strain DSM 19089 / UNIQEM U267 / AHT2) TaxID=589865 RepID=D6Z146_DESAT|nr:type II toxin-antitoxin system VapC family toxin [Desulfurivibrio alkaliphilus]ADH87306.1 PilT protein domain protein [Desulfurivibrio alkaliphilus AHT 2]
MPKLLFDSFALLRFLQKEPGAEKVRELLQRVATGQAVGLINAINVGEIIYLTQRRFGEQKKLATFVNLSRLGLEILPYPNELIFRAAELKARHLISYADAFALASALEHEADLVTGDPEFNHVSHLVNIIRV